MTTFTRTIVALLLCTSPMFAQVGRPLEVPVTSPRGAIASSDQAQTIVASFNQPMTPLAEVPVDLGTGPLVLSPSVRGKYRWMGTATLTFIPERRLPLATAFTATIPAGTKSLSGQVLASDVTWTFETLRPQVARVWPHNSQRFVEPDHTILLQFNQRMEVAGVAPFLSVEMLAPNGERSYPAFTTDRPTGDVEGERERCVLLKPKQALSLGSVVTIVCKRGVKGVEGPLPMRDDWRSSFTVYGELRFIAVKNNDLFNPNEALQLEFTNPVTRKEVAAHLHITPAPVRAIEVEEAYDYPYTEVGLTVSLEAERAYTAILTPGLTDRYGQKLKDTVRFAFRTGPYPSTVWLTTGQGILEAYASHKMPVTFTNIDAVKLDMGRIDPDRIVKVMQRLDYSSYQRLQWEEAILEWVDSKSEDRTQFSLSRMWTPGVPRNTKVIRPLDLDEVLGTAQRGIVLVQIDNLAPEQHRRRYLKTLVQVTDMGITAKFSPEHTLIWVTNLKDASPVGGARVELRNDSNVVMWSGMTDDKGLVKSPGWGRLGMKSLQGNEENEWGNSETPRQWIIVRKGEDVAFSSSDWNNGIEPWLFNVDYEWSPALDQIEGTLFTDRGLYKAGEQVELKGIVRMRSEGAWKIPRRSAFKLTIRDSRNEEVLVANPVLNAFGSFAVSLPLRISSPLGMYFVSLETINEEGSGSAKKTRTRSVAANSFRVEAFRPAEFDVSASLPGTRVIIGDTIEGSWRARYLFGAALKNAPVRWRLSSNRSWARPEGFDGYLFHALEWLTRTNRPAYQVLVSKDTVLDENGGAGMRFPLSVGSLTGPQSITLEAEVTSPTRQVIVGRASTTVLGGEFAIGVAPSTTFLPKDSLLTYRLVAVNPENTLRANERLLVRLYQRIWRSVRKAETGGRYRWESVVDNILKDSSIVITGDAPVIRTYRAAEAGMFYFDISATDRRGNAIVTNASFYVSGSTYVPWERSDDDRIELIADRTNYRPGDVARVLVKSPYEKAPALITIEREGILHQYTTTLAGSAPQIDIPITSAHLPNVFCSVVLLQGRVEGAAVTREADVGRPSFKIGYVTLPVSPEEKHLRVEVRSERPEYRPGDSVTVFVQTKTAAGHGVTAEVAVSVADQGVLNLIGYRMPDAFAAFYRTRGLAVRTTESRIHLIQQRNYDEKGEEPGGGGMDMADQLGFDAEGIRKDFRPSAYWNPFIVTDTSGSATIRFKLPDNLTAFSVMAAAQTVSSDFGYAETELRVAKPLLLQPSMPRFVRVGDSFEGGVVITNNSPHRAHVRLLTHAEGLRFHGEDTVVVTLSAGQSREIRHPMEAQRIGTALLSFRAISDQDQDGLQWKLPIQVPRPRETVALYESTVDEKKREQVTIPRDVHRELGGIELTASSTAMVGLSGGIAYLFDYPYGCLEQRISRVLPLILAKDLIEGFRFEILKGKDHRQVVERMLEEVPSFQRDDGGFAYWKNTNETWPYVSALTVYTLVQATQHGYFVSRRSLDEGLRYVRDVLAGKHSIRHYSQYEWYCTHALVLYTLALNGSPEFGYMEKLFKEREKMPLFARAYLLRALAAAKGNPSMIDELARDLMNNAKVSSTSAHFEEPDGGSLAWVFHSNTRTTALVLQALIESRPENSLVPKAVRWLLDAQRNGRWRTTQENLYVVDALAAYFKVYEKDQPEFQAEIQLAGGTALKQMFFGRSFTTVNASVPMSDLQLGTTYPIDVLRNGRGRMYYGIRMQYYPKGNALVREEGLTLSREIDGAGRDTTGTLVVKAGTMARIRLTITTAQDRNFVVMEDPIPAGFEIVQTAFRTEVQTPPSEGQLDWWWTNPFQHRELYDDRALFFADYLPAGVHSVTYLVRATGYGVFQHPGTHAEGMYEPEVFGQSSSGKLCIE